MPKFGVWPTRHNNRIKSAHQTQNKSHLIFKVKRFFLFTFSPATHLLLLGVFFFFNLDYCLFPFRYKNSLSFRYRLKHVNARSIFGISCPTRWNLSCNIYTLHFCWIYPPPFLSFPPTMFNEHWKHASKKRTIIQNTSNTNWCVLFRIYTQWMFARFSLSCVQQLTFGFHFQFL